VGGVGLYIQMIEIIISIFPDGIPSLSIMLGNKLVKLFPKGFVEEDSIISGVIGFVTYLIVIVLLVMALMRL